MIPTEPPAKSASPPKTGLFAALRGLLHAQGSGAPSRGLIATPLITLCVLCGLLALSATAAQAEPPRLVSYGNFSSEGAFGVAVDQSNSDVYVAGFLNFSTFGEEPVNKFDAAGKLLSPPSPFGEAFYSGVAVNPTNGDVYVLGEAGVFAPATIYTYDPSTGAQLASFEVEASRNILGLFTVVQIAADSAGNVYVPVVSQNEVLEYSPQGTLLKTFTGAGALKEPAGLAVDSSGNLWVADSGNQRIDELNPADVPVGGFQSEGVRSVALDGHGHVFAIVENSADFCGSLEAPCDHLVEYSSSGAQLADIGAGNFGRASSHPSLSMLAVNGSSGRVYVTDDYNSRVSIFGPPKPPTVEKELTAEVGVSEAKLGALANPGGIETSYRFEYGTTTAYGQSTPFPEGSVGEGVAPHAVWAAASGLAPATTYHYRVVAMNELGEAVGPDQTFTTAAEHGACSNETLRTGFSAGLPDCRAYELVTTPTKSSVEIESSSVIRSLSSSLPAARDGNAVPARMSDPLPGAPTGGLNYVATRGADGWSLEDIIPLESYSGIGCNAFADEVMAYSDDLTRALISSGKLTSAAEDEIYGPCNTEGLQVVAGEPVGYLNLLLRDSAVGTYRLVNAPPSGVTPADAHFKGASADLSHVVFGERAPLASNAPYGAEDLYEWDEGALRLLTLLPDGTPVAGSLPKPRSGLNAISADGSHILFTSGTSLYVRLSGERTVEVDESQGGPGPSGGGSLQAVSADGTKVFFLDDRRLTADSTAESGEPDLYECALPEGASKCELSDLTVATPGEHADVLSVSVLGANDNSHMYFVAKGVLATNTREYMNSEGNKVVEGAENGQQNLYLWNGGTTTFIATFGQNDSPRGQASPDGTWFAFDSTKSLTGHDNTPPVGEPVEEVFLYSASANQLVCASCNPSGEAPIGGGIGGGGASIQPSQSQYAPRYLSNGGRLFFETSEALVPSDTNSQADVYEYQSAHLYLISGGTSSKGSAFIDASESGNDVFFLSRQQLVPQDDQEGTLVIYDARVAGGFAAPSPPPPCTTVDACRTPVSPQPSIYGAPSSQTFSGAGNLAPPETKPKATSKARPVKCKQGFVKKKGKCVRKPAKKAKKPAHANRRGK